ncbi:MAG: hypothetical protein ACI38Q_07080 [Candidatus Bruticola sp.]
MIICTIAGIMMGPVVGFTLLLILALSSLLLRPAVGLIKIMWRLVCQMFKICAVSRLLNFVRWLLKGKGK